MNDLKFGDTVTVSLKLVRTNHERNLESIRKTWLAVNTKQKQGIFLGYRSLTNGDVFYNDDTHIYEIKESFKAGLVCINSHTNPYYVPLHDIRKVNK